MREIKFRGKRSDNGEWVYGDLIHNGWDGTSKTVPVGIAEPGCYPVEVIPESVGQFTGLKDKAGKKIYEGDILQMYFRNNQKAGTPFPVAWNDKHAAFTDWWPREGVEVIGNIYENPSLLD